MAVVGQKLGSPDQVIYCIFSHPSYRNFIIERELPAIGSAERQALRDAAQKSNATLKELGPTIQWVESYVANDKTFCVYLAKRRGDRR